MFTHEKNLPAIPYLKTVWQEDSSRNHCFLLLASTTGMKRNLSHRAYHSLPRYTYTENAEPRVNLSNLMLVILVLTSYSRFSHFTFQFSLYSYLLISELENEVYS